MILRYVGDDLGLALVGNRDNRLTFGDDLSGFETHRGNDTSARCTQHGVLQPIARQLELPGRGLGGRRRCFMTGPRLLVVGNADRAVGS